MTIVYSTTNKSSMYPKILVYSKSGRGKTRLCKTAVKPIIISSENKLASLSEVDIPVLQVRTMDDFEDAITEVRTKKYSKKFTTVCVDSITNIVDCAIRAEKKVQKDPRKAYGLVQDKFLDIMYETLPDDKRIWYFIAQARMVINNDGEDIWVPKMPGQQMGPELPYMFDYIFALRCHRNDEEEVTDKVYLQTSIFDDPRWDVKDCSGKLKSREKPNLAAIVRKITKGK